MTAIDLASRVLLRDANLLILDKPAGLAVHPGPSGGPSVEDQAQRLCFGLRHVPVPAHRLDRDTTGCLVLARHPKARTRLGRLFTAGAVGKLYWAICAGVPVADQGVIDLPLAKRTDRSGWRMVADRAKGQRAVTRWRVLGRGDGIAWLELRPETGRTHQIRVHLSEQGWPVLGDPIYGRAGGPMLLHSRRIEVPYWADRPPVVAEAPPPPEFQKAIGRCRPVASPAIEENVG
jgi:tRNA pseudouridine32 synthase/23S rRNA pseudouridine746 synthase